MFRINCDGAKMGAWRTVRKIFLIKERDSEQDGNNGSGKKSLHLYIFLRWSQQVFRIYFESRDTMIDWL